METAPGTITRQHRGRFMRAALRLCLASALVFAALPFGDVRADDDLPVPDVMTQGERQARAVLGRLGFRVGTIYVISRERALAYCEKWSPKAYAATEKLALGHVFLQRPAPGRSYPSGTPVSLVLVGERDANIPPSPRFTKLLPADLAAPETNAPDTAAERSDPPEAATTPPVQPRRDTEPRERPPVRNEPPARTTEPAARRPIPSTPSGDASSSVPPATESTGLVATGNPDTVSPAPAPDREITPPVVGLKVSDAEHLARKSDMVIYTERVPGHPAGRILSQVPEAGEPRGAGGVIKVLVAAGGDVPARVADAPRVRVDDMEIPNVLAEPQAKAERILGDLGFEVEIRAARHGMPGRVQDVQPTPGKIVPKGTKLLVFVAPDPDGVMKRRYVPTSDRGSATPGAAATPVPAAPATAAPQGRAGTAPAGAPRPVAPGAGIVLPGDATVPLGFSWHRVPGAKAYLVEVEEESADGIWLPSSRGTARTTATTLELTRLDTSAKRRFRWRVRAISDAGVGPGSPWIVLR